MRILTVTLLAILGASCSTGRSFATPSELASLPWGTGIDDRAAVQARHLYERGRQRDALGLVAEVLTRTPDHVDAQRLRQDILRTRGRAGLLRAEAEQRVLAAPDDATAVYLDARLAASDEDKLRAFRRAAELAPQSLWPWLGLAYTLRGGDQEAALAIYRDLYERSDKHPVVAIAYAQALRLAGRYRDAVEVYQSLRGNPDVPGTGELGLAQTLLAMEQRREGWPWLLQALRLRPFDTGVQQMVRDLLRMGAPDEQMEQVLDALREEPQRLLDLGRGDGSALLAGLLQRLGQPHSALAALRRAAPGVREPALRRQQRKLLLMTGDVAGYLAALREETPPELLADERNQVRGVWLSLLRGPWFAAGDSTDPLARADRAGQLLRALLAVGQLAEVEQIAELALARFPAASELAQIRDEVRRELAFEGALRRILYGGYLQADTPTLDQVVAQVREVSQAVLGADVVGEVPKFSVPLVGEMVDPFTSGLGAHLARYNRHLVLGRRSGGVVEGMLVTRVSVAELGPDPDLPLAGRCFEIIGRDRDIRSFSGVAGGDLAGVALLNHYVIDLDAVREWSQGIAERRRIALEDDNQLLQDPQPRRVAPGETLDVAWKLSVLSSVQDTDLDAAVLDTIRRHERQHLCDSFHYLPFEQNMWRGLGLLVRFAFSPNAIEGEMERRAELGALATSPYTELVLAHIADFLGDGPPESTHADGFARLARQLTDALVALQVDGTDAQPSRWHRLDMAIVRAAAHRLLEQIR